MDEIFHHYSMPNSCYYKMSRRSLSRIVTMEIIEVNMKKRSKLPGNHFSNK